MIDEQKYVISMFEKNFSKFKNENIAIYGLGKNTKVLLDTFCDYNIIALMDEIKTGENMWGKQVIDCETAHKMGIKVILILARASNVPIIYRRIADDCDKYNIVVMDIEGEQIRRDVENRVKELEFYKENTKEKLLNKIEKCDVVSFDIFDTILMRKTLYPTDVFCYVEKKAKYMGIIEEGFEYSKKRIEAERELYLRRNPTIYDIYDNLVNMGEITYEQSIRLLEMEIEEEINQLICRDEVVDILKWARNIGKKICFTSDMYLTEKHLRRILVEKNIKDIDNIFVSCEYNVGKCNGLFGHVLDCYSNLQILHIGDNYEADYLMAKKYGISDAFPIRSAINMLRDSEFCELLDCVKTVYDRNEIGKFISEQFNNPFVFERLLGKCEIKSSYHMGYRYIEPLVSVFIKWLIDKCISNNISLLILGARDGWLIKEMLDLYDSKIKVPFKYKYVYTSRSVCTISGVKNEDDILYAASLAFSGTQKEMLKKRFRLNDEEIFEWKEGEGFEEYISKHFSYILQKSKSYREKYLMYLHGLGIVDEKKIAFFDFVSSGTCHMWLESILEKDIYGLYFAQLYDPKKSQLCVDSMFEQACVYEKHKCQLLNNYFFMENVFSSPEPSLAYMDENGECVFECESRTAKQLEDVKEVQKGILAAFESRLINEEVECSAKVADSIFGLISSKYAVFDTTYFDDNILVDEYCNRRFEIQQMI